MKKKAAQSKRNRHTGRINAAKQRILDAKVNLNPSTKDTGVFRDYVARVIGGTHYKGIRTRVGDWASIKGVIKDTVTWVKA